MQSAGVRPQGRSIKLASALRRAGAVLLVIATTLFGLLFITFAIGRLVPADPVLAIVGEYADKAAYDRVHAELGLDRPLWEQFADYVGDVVRLDFGRSNLTKTPVLADLARVFPATFELSLIGLIIGAGLGVPLGVVAAVKADTFIDHAARIIGLVGHSTPIFFLATMGLLVFYAGLHWVPGGGRIDIVYEGLVPTVTGSILIDSLLAGDTDVFFDAIRHLLLPGALLGAASMAFISRMTRSFMREQLSQEYILTARAKGLDASTVIWRHAFRNIRVPLLTVVALAFCGMLDGSVLIETVFGWPGVGQYLTRALFYSDMNATLGAVLLIGFIAVSINLLCDYLYKVFDPRTGG